jgi:hypothetical protein
MRASTGQDKGIREKGCCHPRTASNAVIKSQFIVDRTCDSKESKRDSGFGSYCRTLKKGTSQPMRLVKRLHILFLLLLSLGLSCSEVPESFNLCDDASNDFVEESCVPHSRYTETAPEDVIPQPRVSIADVVITTPPILSLGEVSPFAGPDLLQLLTVQRK